MTNEATANLMFPNTDSQYEEEQAFALPVLKSSWFSEWFENPKSFISWTGLPGILDIIRWKFVEADLSTLPDLETLDQKIPVKRLERFEGNSSLYATWLGHATVLVHMEGANFITDPIWANRASPFSFAGPLRYRLPPMDIENLPTIDFAVISHDHYDHLDKDSVIKIAQKNKNIRWFVPLKMKEWMVSIGLPSNSVSELNWGRQEDITINKENQEIKFTIFCSPAQHWGRRGLFDENKVIFFIFKNFGQRLWSGWVVLGPTKKFYYTGDTGYCEEEFVKLGKRFGAFDLAAIPIGAYEPRWFMKSQHINPEEAVNIHKQINSKMSIGIHWGTYQMGSYESYLAPKEELLKRMKHEHGFPFKTIDMGEIWEEKDETSTNKNIQ